MSEIEELAGLSGEHSEPGEICSSIAKIFEVRQTEVALLQTAGRLLKFLHPGELQAAGAIPFSSSAVAAGPREPSVLSFSTPSPGLNIPAFLRLSPWVKPERPRKSFRSSCQRPF